MSSPYPSARSVLPTRPGVDVSPCSTIRIGSKGDTGDRKGDADSLPGKRRTVSVLALIGRNDIVLQAFPVRTDAKRLPGDHALRAGIIPKQTLISYELGLSSKQIAGQKPTLMRPFRAFSSPRVARMRAR